MILRERFIWHAGVVGGGSGFRKAWGKSSLCCLRPKREQVRQSVKSMILRERFIWHAGVVGGGSGFRKAWGKSSLCCLRPKREQVRQSVKSMILRERFIWHAGVAQLAEYQPSKLRVAGSRPVSRFFDSKRAKSKKGLGLYGSVAEFIEDRPFIYTGLYGPCGSVAEHSLGKAGVVGSIPAVGSIYKTLWRGFFFALRGFFSGWGMQLFKFMRGFFSL